MSAEVNKRGVVLTLLILSSICYILYSNSDEIQSDSAIQVDALSMIKAKQKLDKLGPELADNEKDEVDPEIGLDVEYVEDFVLIDGINVFYSYAMSTVKNQPPPRFAVLLLHGAAYEANTWKSLGTLQFLAKSGYFPIAVDLPGFGKTKADKRIDHEDAFLSKLIKALPQTDRPVIICPSMSGRYALPFMFKHRAELRGIVPIAPINGNHYKKEEYEQLHIPALIYYGSLDEHGAKTSNLMAHIPGSRIVEVPNGMHPAYLDDLILFHTEVKNFLDNVYKKEMAS
ncbi:putative protein-lysine deacylase ABHD14B [Styela clava]|uniref:protein ABHD14B-like n=1 Tax=Styela clava TaxID=7725 RepID=UPI001939800E|nr:protein ABHD14B-like [Styela clava]